MTTKTVGSPALATKIVGDLVTVNMTVNHQGGAESASVTLILKNPASGQILNPAAIAALAVSNDPTPMPYNKSLLFFAPNFIGSNDLEIWVSSQVIGVFLVLTIPDAINIQSTPTTTTVTIPPDAIIFT